jgi:hypothetical protein
MHPNFFSSKNCSVAFHNTEISIQYCLHYKLLGRSLVEGWSNFVAALCVHTGKVHFLNRAARKLTKSNVSVTNCFELKIFMFFFAFIKSC